MAMAVTLVTPRLVLREWRDEDAAAFAAMSADPGLSEFLLPPDPGWVARARLFWAEHGFGQFVVALPGEAAFVGVVMPKWSGAIPASFFYARDGRQIGQLLGESNRDTYEAAIRTVLSSGAAGN